jgi:cobalt/nickel transport system permease protein
MRTEPRLLSPLHPLPAGTKLGATAIIILATTLLPPRVTSLYLAPAGLVLALWLVARVPFRHGLRRLLVAELFIIGIALFALFSPTHRMAFISAFIKSNICVAMMIVLTWTTSFSDLLAVLSRLRIPSIMLTTLALMYRYLPVLGEESRRMVRARKSRTFSAKRSLVWGSLGTIITHLFLRSVDRAERIYLAMCARGWK